MQNKSHLGFHLLAFVVSCIWGSTFVASKVLLNAGLSPAQIMCMRFAIAYFAFLPFCRHKIKADSLRDELLFIALGLTGGSLYFLTENSALQYTTSTSTVAMLITTTPVLTAFVVRAIFPSEKLSRRFMFGSLVALIGVALVIFNGVFILDDNPLVALLAFSASLCWAFYGLLLRKLETSYSTAFITRKVFFWGVVTMLPVCLVEDHSFDFSNLLSLNVGLPLLFLSLIASLACYQMWNMASKGLGIVVATNYLYFQPITSLVTGYLVLNERITLLAIFGCLLVIDGVYLCNKKRKSKQ